MSVSVVGRGRSLRARRLLHEAGVYRDSANSVFGCQSSSVRADSEMAWRSPPPRRPEQSWVVPGACPGWSRLASCSGDSPVPLRRPRPRSGRRGLAGVGHCPVGTPRGSPRSSFPGGPSEHPSVREREVASCSVERPAGILVPPADRVSRETIRPPSPASRAGPEERQARSVGIVVVLRVLLLRVVRCGGSSHLAVSDSIEPTVHSRFAGRLPPRRSVRPISHRLSGWHHKTEVYLHPDGAGPPHLACSPDRVWP